MASLGTRSNHKDLFTKMASFKSLLRHTTAMIWSILVLVLMLSFLEVQAAELTFELPDRAKMCFYEEIQSGTACALEYQVSTTCRDRVHTVIPN